MKGLTKKAQIQWIITIVVLIALVLVPVTETFTGQMKAFLAITITGILCMVFGLVNNIVPALLIPAAYVVFGVLDRAAAFNAWTGNVVWAALGCFIMANMMERTGLMKRVSYHCILLTGASYKGIIYGLIIAGIVINIISAGSTGLVFATMAFAYSICKALELGRSKAAGGIMMASTIGMIAVGHFIYTPASLGVLFGAIEDGVSKPGYLDFFVQNAIFVPLMFLLGFMIIRVMKPEKPINGKEFFKAELAAMGKMTPEEIKIAVMLGITVILLVTEQFHGIGSEMILIIMPMLMYLPLINVGRIEDVVKVKFPTIFFIAGCLSIGTAARASGLAGVIANWILPLLSNGNIWIVIAVVWLFGFGINFLLTPLAAMGAFSAPLTQISTGLGINPLPVLYSFFQGLDNLILPYERSLFLVCFGYDLIDLKDFAKVMAWKALIGFAYILIIGVPYWKLIGLL